MAYNEALNHRLKSIFKDSDTIISKKMFGGIGYLLNGNMVCGDYKDDLILRMSPKDADKSLSLKHIKVFDITGRAMKSWIMVEPESILSDNDLKKWINISLSFVKLLPPK